jgi:endonuclease/exonuclease/phosphatase family metal-dependent hydrolase
MWYNDIRPDKELENDRYSLIMLDTAENGYKRLMDDATKKRTTENLIRLKEGLTQKVPPKKVNDNLLLCSWNIKNFGELKNRTAESLYYIAEIISAFDIISLQEVNKNISDFKKVLRLLGSHWKYILSDVTEGDAGNDERFGFLYDSRRVTHSGLSGELVISPEMMAENPVIRQLNRTPIFTGFESGWQKFSVVSLHLEPGNSSKKKKIRKEEVRLLMEIMKLKLHAMSYEDQNMIILGDTNLYKNNDDIVQLFYDAGFIESDGLIGKYTNTSQSEIYDRIFLNVRNYFQLEKDATGNQVGDVFPLFDYIYKNDTDEAIKEYHSLMKQHKGDPSTLTSDAKFKKYFDEHWKRNQISDHLPVWIEIKTNNSVSFLKNKLKKF